MRTSLRFRLAAALSILAVPANASEVVTSLPGAEITSCLNCFDVHPQTGNSEGSISNSSGYASTFLSPNPNVTADYAETTGDNNASEADIWYYAEVIGPASSTIPVDLAYSGYTNVLNYTGVVNAVAGFPTTEGNLPVYGTVFSGEGPINQSFSGVVSELVSEGNPFVISVGAQAADGPAYLYVDPILSIDPSFAAVDPNYKTDYSIELSSGVGNAASAVPEPATWAMMLIGLSVIGYGMRKGTRVRRSDVLALSEIAPCALAGPKVFRRSLVCWAAHFS